MRFQPRPLIPGLFDQHDDQDVKAVAFVLTRVFSDQALLRLLRTEEYGILVATGRCTNTPATRNRPGGNIAIQAGRRDGAIARRKIATLLRAAGVSTSSVGRNSEDIVQRLLDHVRAEREGGRRGGRTPRAPRPRMLPGLEHSRRS